MFEQCELMLSELVTVLGYIGISDFAWFFCGSESPSETLTHKSMITMIPTLKMDGFPHPSLAGKGFGMYYCYC